MQLSTKRLWKKGKSGSDRRRRSLVEKQLEELQHGEVVDTADEDSDVQNSFKTVGNEEEVEDALERDTRSRAELEKRVKWLEAERVRLLQLSRNGSFRSDATIMSPLSVASPSSCKGFFRDADDDSAPTDKENAASRENRPSAGSSKLRLSQKLYPKSSKRGDKSAKKGKQPKPATPGALPAPLDTSAPDEAALTEAAAALDGCTKVVEKQFTVDVNLGTDLPAHADFAEACGLRLECHDGRLVVEEFLRDNQGYPGRLEACGRVNVQDILEHVQGEPVSSMEELGRLFGSADRSTAVQFGFARRGPRQVTGVVPGSLEQARDQIKFLEAELKFAQAEYARLDIGALEGLQVMLDDTRQHAASLERDLARLRRFERDVQRDEELARKFALKERECRRLLNTLIELKGAIRVFVRVRPVHVSNVNDFDNNREVLQYPDNGSIVLSDLQSSDVPEKSWQFDAVFDPNSTQSEVAGEVEPLVQSVVDGYNACVFAYGQTGSGKTYTMDGPSHDRGIYYRATDMLFNAIDKRLDDFRDAGKETLSVTVKVSVLEIYQERVRDLLSVQDDANAESALEAGEGDKDRNAPAGGSRTPGKKPKQASPFSLDIMHHPKSGYVYVQGAKEEVATSAAEVHEILERGKQHRVVGVTNMNEHSSRSHMILLVSVISKVLESDSTTIKHQSRSKLQLIDLAGSERASSVENGGQRLRETCHINKSLSALGDVMQALQNNGSRHIPFRNSKLTSLLRDSLGGKAKTLMMIQVSPMKLHMWETMRTLEFAQRVGKISFGGTSDRNAGSSEQLSRLKRDNAEQASELQRVRQRVLTIRQQLDAEKLAKQSVTNSLKTLQNQHEAENAEWNRVKQELEGQVLSLQKKVKELGRKSEDEQRSKEESGIKRSQHEAHVAQSEVKLLRTRNTELKRKYQDAVHRIDALEKAAELRGGGGTPTLSREHSRRLTRAQNGSSNSINSNSGSLKSLFDEAKSSSN
ncbi:Kinesin-like protein KIN-14Q [Durusdinium trenchii]|uniref:Kinesin-like protein n=1 Tax=Durusdinium trenchii TaxID=1381693 RepID=A0ABP0JCW2_9DINO